ncbi:hypothetical protein TNCV_4573851 [Trichonephila clavipes]|nr:hypothetical protein TNCV_4573851 [Trichonephila clavipes]
MTPKGYGSPMKLLAQLLVKLHRELDWRDLVTCEDACLSDPKSSLLEKDIAIILARVMLEKHEDKMRKGVSCAYGNYPLEMEVQGPGKEGKYYGISNLVDVPCEEGVTGVTRRVLPKGASYRRK